MKKLNLGCGNDIREGYLNVDISPHKGVDIVADLNETPYPIKDDTYDKIIAFFILEHLKDTEKCLKEWHRILKPGGKLIIKVPYDSSYSAWANFQHKTCFNLHTFRMFAKNTKKTAKTNEYGLEFMFSSLKQELWFPKGFHIFNHILEPIFNSIKTIYEETALRVLFPAHSIIVELKK